VRFLLLSLFPVVNNILNPVLTLWRLKNLSICCLKPCGLDTPPASLTQELMVDLPAKDQTDDSGDKRTRDSVHGEHASTIAVAQVSLNAADTDHHILPFDVSDNARGPQEVSIISGDLRQAAIIYARPLPLAALPPVGHSGLLEGAPDVDDAAVTSPAPIQSRE
jgi:hypothetical protein